MESYLVVITTVLVATQVIRIVQNTISLYRQNRDVKKICGWIKDNDVSEKDFEVQRSVYYMLHEALEDKGYSYSRKNIK